MSTIRQSFVISSQIISLSISLKTPTMKGTGAANTSKRFLGNIGIAVWHQEKGSKKHCIPIAADESMGRLSAMNIIEVSVMSVVKSSVKSAGERT